MPLKTSTETKPMIISFHVETSGKVNDLKVIESSGWSVTDELALKAVKEASPFRAMPKVPAGLDVKFTFDAQGVELVKPQSPGSQSQEKPRGF